MVNAAPINVGLELALLVDASGSVSASEYSLQKSGYVNAFQNPTIQSLIGNQPGGIAVTYIEWSGSSQQSQLVDWTHITNATTANSFASTLSATGRAYSGATAPGSAIDFALPLFSGNGFTSSKWIMDVSGDGTENAGANTASARDNALANGVTAINGLPIGGGAFLKSWYQNNIVGGTSAFLIQANSFSDFETAVEQKLYKEISGDTVAVPEPSSLGLLFFGLAALTGMFALRRRIG
ncbi:DUF1194 domain-containing protein [Acidihalobacter ferrooxydans]|nr:DUF1194 domain-containing protein [Acidihalobacter ferrooxydans]